MMKKMTVLLALGCLALGLAAGCSDKASATREAAGRHKQAANPVVVADVVEKDVPVQLRAVGKVEAYSTVSVKAQAAGELIEVHVSDGQCVKAGDPLFAIDPRPYQAELKRAEAVLAKDKAQLSHADKQLERNASVVGQGYVSKDQYDQAVANAQALKASVEADEAAVENARIQLGYCRIDSPINGCAGEVKIHQGNLVKAGDNDYPLVVINQVSPIYVSFSVPEKNLPEIRKYMAAERIAVDAAVPGSRDKPVRGRLTFFDNTVDSATGTILLKAAFPNTDKSLWPGQYVNVVLNLTSQKGALVIPSQAVQTGQEGQYVFVVGADLSAQYRLVGVQRIEGGEAVIGTGLRVGERVVTDGQLRLSQNAPVKIVEGVEGRPVEEALQ